MSLTCWILTDGRIGTENNARGLAEALGLDYTLRKIRLKQPWRTLSPWLRLGLAHAFHDAPLLPPWPDILITAGRTPAVGSLYVGQQSKDTVRIHITNPAISPELFDLVITPRHDRLSGSNVIETTGALHRITDTRLAEAAALWAPRFSQLPRPWQGLLVGGDAHGYTLDANTVSCFMPRIRQRGGSILATVSRRTGSEARAAIAATADYLWDGTGDNPFLGLLALADELYVTADSVSMLSEAAFTGKRVWLLDLAGAGDAKLRRCHEALTGGGHISRFPPTGAESPPVRLDDMAGVCTRIRKLLVARGKLSR